MVDGGAHELDGAIGISTPSPLTRQVDIEHRQIAQVVFPTDHRFADSREQLLSAVTLRSRVAVHQRKPQRHPGVGQRDVITGSFGDPQGILALAHRAIIGRKHATRDSRPVGEADNRGVRHGVGAARHGQSMPQVVLPSGAAQATTGESARREGDR